MIEARIDGERAVEAGSIACRFCQVLCSDERRWLCPINGECIDCTIAFSVTFVLAQKSRMNELRAALDYVVAFKWDPSHLQFGA